MGLKRQMRKERKAFLWKKAYGNWDNEDVIEKFRIKSVTFNFI